MKNGWTSKTKLVGFAFYSQAIVLMGASALSFYGGSDVISPLVPLIIAYFTSMTAVVGAYLHFSPPVMNQGMGYGGYGYNNYGTQMRPITAAPIVRKNAIDNPDT